MAAVLRVVEQAGEAVRFVQRVQERLRQVAFVLQVVQHAREEEVVQHDDAGHVADQLEHVLVRVRIAEVVDDAVERMRVGAQPVGRPLRETGHARIDHAFLVDDEVDLVILRQLRQQFRAVVGNAALLWWHG